MSKTSGPPPTILIVGGGEFGLSFALSLAQSPKYQGYTDRITVLDRSADPPSLDAASSDLNKIIRSDYSDPYYQSLSSLALSAWRLPPYAPYYHESGTVIVSSSTNAIGSAYVQSSYKLNKNFGAKWLEGKQEFQDSYPSGVERGIGKKEEVVGYFNKGCGWAEAREACLLLVRMCRALGVQFVAGEVASLVPSGSDVAGIETVDGRIFKADKTVLATGAWTSALLPELGEELLATGQIVGTIQLGMGERERYLKSPVTFFLDTGFYCFPPNAEGTLKFALHGPGYLNPTTTNPSTPRTSRTHSKDQIPREAVDTLRKELGRIYPGLVGRKWEGSRMCWYTDTPTSNWLICPHPRLPSLFLATGGSGHAFKFLPILGDLILSIFNQTASREDMERFGWEGIRGEGADKSRESTMAGEPGSGRKVFREEEMASLEELGGDRKAAL